MKIVLLSQSKGVEVINDENPEPRYVAEGANKIPHVLVVGNEIYTPSVAVFGDETGEIAGHVYLKAHVRRISKSKKPKKSLV